VPASVASAAGSGTPFAGAGPHLFTHLADTPTKIDWVVDGLVSTGSVIIAAGSPKLSKKSWTMMHLACCVASGTPFFGRKVARRPVIYTFMEDGPHRVAARLNMLTTVRGLDRDGPVAGIPAAYFGIEGFNKVNQLVQDMSPCLWIIDPLIEVLHAMNLDENSSTDMSKFMTGFRSTVQHTRSALMLVHHYTFGFKNNSMSAFLCSVRKVNIFPIKRRI
jgi:RecA-family ATPase